MLSGEVRTLSRNGDDGHPPLGYFYFTTPPMDFRIHLLFGLCTDPPHSSLVVGAPGTPATPHSSLVVVASMAPRHDSAPPVATDQGYTAFTTNNPGLAAHRRGPTTADPPEERSCRSQGSVPFPPSTAFLAASRNPCSSRFFDQVVAKRRRSRTSLGRTITFPVSESAKTASCINPMES